MEISFSNNSKEPLSTTGRIKAGRSLSLVIRKLEFFKSPMLHSPRSKTIGVTEIKEVQQRARQGKDFVKTFCFCFRSYRSEVETRVSFYRQIREENRRRRRKWLVPSKSTEFSSFFASKSLRLHCDCSLSRERPSHQRDLH